MHIIRISFLCFIFLFNRSHSIPFSMHFQKSKNKNLSIIFSIEFQYSYIKKNKNHTWYLIFYWISNNHFHKRNSFSTSHFQPHSNMHFQYNKIESIYSISIKFQNAFSNPNIYISKNNNLRFLKTDHRWKNIETIKKFILKFSTQSRPMQIRNRWMKYNYIL